MAPSPAVLGAAALVIAGGGAVIVSSSSSANQPDSQSAAAGHSGQRGTSYARGGLEISRSVDRKTREQQAEAQARQTVRAMRDLAKQTQRHSNQLEANQWVLPLVGFSLSAGYGETSYLWSTYHTGLDFSAATGTDIVSVARGTVTDTGYDGSYGYKVEVTLEDGTAIWYCHMTSYVVEEGQEVDPGELLGYVGSSGNTTGPHLHLEVRIPDGTEEGQDVDPIPVLEDHGITL